MTLETCIQKAIDLTEDLAKALTEDQMDLCRTLVAQRGIVMQQFEALHTQADDGLRATLAPRVQDLTKVDRDLQEQFASSLKATATNLSQHRPGNFTRPPLPARAGSTPGNLDLKA